MELARFPLHGGFSVRSILKFALAAFTTVFLWVLLVGTPVHAADATWNNESVVYENHVYTAVEPSEYPSGIPSDAKAYTYRPGAPTSAPSAGLKAYFIYFASGVDPPTATSAQYVAYDFNTADSTYSNPQDAKSISVTPQSEQATTTSCAVDGVGWIVCPVTTALAESMDFLFDIIAGFLKVQPILTNNTDNGLYTAWNITRNIANLAFLIAFLLIIYSQLTNYGVSNYGIKRLLPRLILAAILMNLSFVIVAVAIDISNILGYSIQNVFEYIRSEVFHMSADTLGSGLTSDWAALTSVVLSGAGIVGGIYAVSSGAYILLIPVVVILALTLLLVLVVLAARQAIIIILVVVAPLAFVANLLPNTEKWFGKWRDLFMTMLIFFPAFSLAFGGSQLAGQIIIMNAGDNIITVIFGMAVQIAPLVITPLLLKLSGGLLGRIAQIANNPNKGLIDRNKKWAQDRAELKRQRTIGKDITGRKKYDPRLFGNRMVKANEFRRRGLADKLEKAKIDATNRYEESSPYEKRHVEKATSEAERDTIHNRHAEHLEHLKTRQGTRLQEKTAALEASKAGLEGSQKRTERYYNTAKRNEAFANRIGASALYQSAYGLENEKQLAESSQNRLAEYYDKERTVVGTKLERSAVLAASSKEHLESAQQRLQAHFDVQRKDKSTGLGKSTIVLENSKSVAEKAKSGLTEYILNERTSQNGSLKTVTFEAEQAKIGQQKAEETMTKMVSELKSGKIDKATLTQEQFKIMGDIHNDAIKINAIKRGSESAQYELQTRFADIMTGADTSSPIEIALTEEMRSIAQGVGGETARVRAISNAVATARGLDSDALKANVQLLTDEARREGTNIKHYSRGIIETVLEGKSVMPNGTVLTPERIKAALQAQAEEKNIPIFEKVMGSPYFDDDMKREIVSLNSAPFKAAGAFAMQDQLRTLSDFATPEEYKHQLSLDHVSNLANANATGLAGWKAGEIVEVAKSLDADIKASLIEIARGEAPGASIQQIEAADEARNNLKAAYKTVRDALNNPDILGTMNDREAPVRAIEAELARLHGQEPVPDTPVELQFDATSYTPGESLNDIPDAKEDDESNN